MNKFYSRKFAFTLLNYILASVLLYFGKFDAMYFTIFLLSSYLIYIFVEGSIDFTSIKKINLGGFEYEREDSIRKNRRTTEKNRNETPKL